MQIDSNAGFSIEKMNVSHSHCDCCRRLSHSVAGLLYNGGVAAAAYWVHWTEGHLNDLGANFDLVLGPWGEGTGPTDRYAIAMVHRQLSDGTPSLMVINAEGRPAADGSLAHIGLRRDQVIGTPLAAKVFAMTDAIYEQDDRFF
jgi:hypothetical protein